MASLVPGYEHDVFVSYATVDDRPAKRGWVSALVNTLGESLAAAFGDKDPDRIWWDRSNIDEESPLTEQIRSKVEKSACLVVILSQGYKKSKWCRQEREAFLAAVAGRPEADRRLFLIDIGNVEQKDRPQEFRNIRGRFFYVQPPNTTSPSDREPLGFPTPDPENKDHKEFFARVEQLAKDLCERVNELSGAEAEARPQKTCPNVTLFVAEPADDVADEHEELVRFLSDHFQILPAIDDPLPGQWDQWQTSIDSALAASSLFVQVLGALPGKRIVGSDYRLVTAQFDRAQAAGQKIVTWRKTTAESVAHDRLKEIVTLAEYCGPLEQFKAEVKRIATPVPPPKTIERPAFVGEQAPPSVFIHAGVEDEDQASRLLAALSRMDCFASIPLMRATPEEIRNDLEANLTECDGLILFYGRTPLEFLRTQFRRLPQTLSKRSQLQPPRPLKALAICNGEPPGKPPPGFTAPGLDTFDLSLDGHREQLARWVDELRNGGST